MRYVSELRPNQRERQRRDLREALPNISNISWLKVVNGWVCVRHKAPLNSLTQSFYTAPQILRRITFAKMKIGMKWSFAWYDTVSLGENSVQVHVSHQWTYQHEIRTYSRCSQMWDIHSLQSYNQKCMYNSPTIVTFMVLPKKLLAGGKNKMTSDQKPPSVRGSP